MMTALRMKGVVVVLVMIAIDAALRKSCGLIELMKYSLSMYTKMTRANGNEG